MNNAFEQFGWQQKQGGGSVETVEVLPHFLLLEFCYSGCLLLQHGRQTLLQNPPKLLPLVTFGLLEH